MEVKSKVISDFDAVSRFRDILFYELIIPPSVGILFYPLQYLIIYLSNDPMVNLKLVLILITTAAVLFTPYILRINKGKALWLDSYIFCYDCTSPDSWVFYFQRYASI